MTHVFPSLVERWRGLLVHAAPDLPIDFLLHWVENESGGRADIPVSSIGERGLFQIHPDECPAIGLTVTQFAGLVGGGPLDAGGVDQVAYGVRLVRYYLAMARRLLSFVGGKWEVDGTAAGRSLCCLAKLCHALPLAASSAVHGYHDVTGHAPTTWDDLATWCRANRAVACFHVIESRWGGIERFLRNAEGSGGWVVDPQPHGAVPSAPTLTPVLPDSDVFTSAEREAAAVLRPVLEAVEETVQEVTGLVTGEGPKVG